MKYKNLIILFLTSTTLLACSNNPEKSFTKSPCARYCNYEDFTKNEEYK